MSADLLPGCSAYEGTLGRTVFEGEGFAIVWFHPVDGSKATKLVFKHVSKPANFAHVRIQASVTRHERFGDQLIVQKLDEHVPSIDGGLARYLSENFKGIGPKTAERIVATFGEGTKLAMGDAAKLAEILPNQLAVDVSAAWAKLQDRNEIFPFLHEHGFGPKLCERIFFAYGKKSLDVAKTNPYAFLRVDGVGFLTADRLAMSMGYEPTAEKRLMACIEYVLANVQGDVCLSLTTLLSECEKYLKLADPLLVEVLRATVLKLVDSNRLVAWEKPVTGDTSIFHPVSNQVEAKLADRLSSICRARIPKMSESTLESLLTKYEKDSEIALAPSQKDGVLSLHNASFVVITGGPGTGKTTLLRAACDVYEQMGLTIELAAPTGRAAKRMTELSGRPARTIHRLLEFSPETGDFLRKAHNPIGRQHSEQCAKAKYKECSCEFFLPPTLLVVDETSMLDMQLAGSLIEAIYYGTRVMFVGDVDQLPSVGAGAVLRDIIQSGVCRVIRLSHIWRQGHESSIPEASASIMRGEVPTTDGDFFVVQPSPTVDYVVELVRRTAIRLSLKTQEVQVLVPMKRGEVGMNALNLAMQKAFNPPRSSMEQMLLAGYCLREGDKVIQLKNDYDKEVFNGEIGTVSQVVSDPFSVKVLFDGREVFYENRDELDMLQLSYAMTIHKSQGSEYPAVIVLALPEHWHMLNRNLLYTAVTRAKRLCIVITDKTARALTRACDSAADGRRTHLADRIRLEINNEDEEVKF